MNLFKIFFGTMAVLSLVIEYYYFICTSDYIYVVIFGIIGATNALLFMKEFKDQKELMHD